MHKLHLLITFIEGIIYPQIWVELDFRLQSSFSQFMRLNPFQIESLSKKILNTLEEKQAVQFRDGKAVALQKGIELVTENYDAEKSLEDDVNRQIDDLESQQNEGFNRHQMFKMLKKKVAEERGFIL